MNKRPIAVLISDIHFTVQTLELASQALLKAQFKAKMLDVPLVIAGDTLDSKAIIRAECANRLLQLLGVSDAPKTYIMVGNHDLCNEKGNENSLNFLHGWQKDLTVVRNPMEVNLCGVIVQLIPYQSDLKKLKDLLKEEYLAKTIIMHQGLEGADMGHYVLDKTSLSKRWFSEYRVISGHYHKAQDIQCRQDIKEGNIGLFSYIGNPYTLSFGEADHDLKGYRILYSDGSLETVYLGLRKHCKIDLNTSDLLGKHGFAVPYFDKDDLLWVKLYGPKYELDQISKDWLAKTLVYHNNFKLDKINSDKTESFKKSNMSSHNVLDILIDQTSESAEQKKTLKSIWRNLLESNIS